MSFITAHDNDFRPAGQLFESWASDPSSVPETSAERLRAIQTIGRLDVPASVRNVRVLIEDEDTLTLVIPSAAMIRAAKAAVAASETYPLEPEYRLQINGLPARMPNRDFLQFRIGEYCISRCK